MKFFNCPNCDSRFPVKPPECPSCGEAIEPSAWKEIEADPPPMPSAPRLVELHGDKGRPFVFRLQPAPMGAGRISLSAVSSQANFCEREQFVLSWDRGRCFASPPATPPRNDTCIDGAKLCGRVELKQGATIELRGRSGKTAMRLAVLYS